MPQVFLSVRECQLVLLNCGFRKKSFIMNDFLRNPHFNLVIVFLCPRSCLPLSLISSHIQNLHHSYHVQNSSPKGFPKEFPKEFPIVDNNWQNLITQKLLFAPSIFTSSLEFEILFDLVFSISQFLHISFFSPFPQKPDTKKYPGSALGHGKTRWNIGIFSCEYNGKLNNVVELSPKGMCILDRLPSNRYWLYHADLPTNNRSKKFI